MGTVLVGFGAIALVMVVLGTYSFVKNELPWGMFLMQLAYTLAAIMWTSLAVGMIATTNNRVSAVDQKVDRLLLEHGIVAVEADEDKAR